MLKFLEIQYWYENCCLKLCWTAPNKKILETATSCQYSVNYKNNENIRTYNNSFNLYINHTFNDWIKYDAKTNKAHLTAEIINNKNIDILSADNLIIKDLFIEDISPVMSLNNLRYLDFSGNNISEIPEGFFILNQLEELNLDNNKIKETKNLMKLNLIKIIKLNNNIVDKTPNGNKSLEHLYLNNNNIRQISPSSYDLINLKTLEIKSNQYNQNINLNNMQPKLKEWIQNLKKFECSCIYDQLYRP